jgi:hypothetical protein
MSLVSKMVGCNSYRGGTGVTLLLHGWYTV